MMYVGAEHATSELADDMAVVSSDSGVCALVCGLIKRLPGTLCESPLLVVPHQSEMADSSEKC